MKFEWDEAKAASNYAKHGIRFMTALHVFEGFYVERKLPYEKENRYKVTGLVEGAFVTVIYTKRGKNIRLISARHARKEEKLLYYHDVLE